MDDEKNQKGNGSTERANKTSKTQSERFLAMQINNNTKTYSLTKSLNHRCEMARLKPVYRYLRYKNKNH